MVKRYKDDLSSLMTENFQIEKTGSILYRLSENTKSEKFDVGIKGLITQKSMKIPILGHPVYL